MTKGIYIHRKTGVEYELLDDNVTNKDDESRSCLYCEKGKPQKWYTRNIAHFQKSFDYKKSN